MYERDLTYSRCCVCIYYHDYHDCSGVLGWGWYRAGRGSGLPAAERGVTAGSVMGAHSKVSSST